MLHMTLAGLRGSVAFDENSEPLADMLSNVLLGWPASSIRDHGPSRDASFTVLRTRRGFRVANADRRWMSAPDTDVGTLSTLIVEVVNAWVAASPGMGCLHSAAVELGGRLVLFPATHRAGKSTLATALLARGHKVFADDIIPLDLESGTGLASGCLPRLRLPVPRGASELFQRHVRDHLVATDGYYGYVTGHPDTLAVHGMSAQIAGIVLLERCAHRVSATLSPARVDEALLQLLLRNTRAELDAARLLAAMKPLAARCRTERLCFSDVDEAADLLENTFSTWPTSTAAAQDEDFVDVPRSEGRAALSNRSGRGALCYRRRPAIGFQEIGGSGFLVDPACNATFRLDALGRGIWHLLEHPIEPAVLSDIVADAFPDRDPAVVARDVQTLLSRLIETALIEPVTAG